MPESRICNYEQGTRLPDITTIEQLAQALDVSPSYLLGFADAPSSREEAALLAIYRATDDRGKRAIFSIAESQPAYDAELTAARRR